MKLFKMSTSVSFDGFFLFLFFLIIVEESAGLAAVFTEAAIFVDSPGFFSMLSFMDGCLI